jgi:hypothetical protein
MLLPAQRPPVAATKGRMCSCCGRRIKDGEASYIHLGPGREVCWTCMAPKGLQWDFRNAVMPNETNGKGF